MTPPAEPADPTTIVATLRAGRQELAAAGIADPALDAEVLLRNVLGIDRTALFSRLQEPIPAAASARFLALIRERAHGAPVAYLTGEREFMGLPFIVRPGVLIPRPETEILVEWALDWLRPRPAVTVVDVGAGSGAIALSLAHELGRRSHVRVIAADVSVEALQVAAENRRRFGLQHRVALVRGSLLDWLGGPIDLVMANLPYLRPGQIAANPALAAEPRLALDGGEEGIDLITALLRDAPRLLRPGGALGLEIDPSQRQRLTALAAAIIPASQIEILPDLAGHDRHLLIQLPHPSAR